VIASRDEVLPLDFEPLLEQVIVGGGRIGPTLTIATMRSWLDAELRDLPYQALPLSSPLVSVAALSGALRALDDRLRRSARVNSSS
jgi:hypothetical protein